MIQPCRPRLPRAAPGRRWRGGAVPVSCPLSLACNVMAQVSCIIDVTLFLPPVRMAQLCHNIALMSRHTPNMLFGGPLSSQGHQFRRWTVDPAGMAADPMESANRFWKSMVPHFTDQAEGIAWVVDRWLAQAFVQDCAPDDWIVWSGAPTGGRTRTAPSRNPDGLLRREDGFQHVWEGEFRHAP